MDQAQEAIEETAENVNPMDLDPSVFGPSNFVRSEYDSTAALVKIS